MYALQGTKLGLGLVCIQSQVPNLGLSYQQARIHAPGQVLAGSMSAPNGLQASQWQE
jgi:hypothetical protein